MIVLSHKGSVAHSRCFTLRRSSFPNHYESSVNVQSLVPQLAVKGEDSSVNAVLHKGQNSSVSTISGFEAVFIIKGIWENSNI